MRVIPMSPQFLAGLLMAIARVQASARSFR